MEGQVKITAEERKRLDRQRFIGLETQRKLLSSRILITPANGPNTELAKNLVLAGVNITLYDNEIATEDDFETNFLVGLKEIGQKRGEVIFERLKQMNPSGINEFFCQSINENELNEAFLSRFTIVCTSFSDLTVVQKWDKATKKANKPFYNIFSAGVSSACFISLGSCYTYKQSPTKPNPKQYQIQSLSVEECLQKQQVKKSRRKQFQIIQAMISNYLILQIQVMRESQKAGLTYNPYNKMKMDDEMLFCMVDLGEDIKDGVKRKFLVDFAMLYGIDYCPVYSVIGSIVSQEIIKVVQNQQEPAVNWIVMNSDEGYACVLKLSKQNEKITSKLLQELQ